LGASEKRAERSGVNVERGGEFAVAEIVAAQEQEFGLARGERGEDDADAVLLFGGGVELFGRWIAANDCEEALVALAAGLAAEFVEAKADGGAVEPRFGLRRVGLRGAPEADEGFDGEFFGAGGIADDSGDDACYAIEAGAEEGFNVEGCGGRGRGFEDGFTRCGHIHITTDGLSL